MAQTRWLAPLSLTCVALAAIALAALARPSGPAPGSAATAPPTVQIATAERTVYIVEGRQVYVYAWDASADVAFGHQQQKLVLATTFTVGDKSATVREAGLH